MSGIRVGRLRKLAKHLRGNHLAHRIFYFDRLADGKLDKDGNYCGSVGCAIGELPAVWPKEWNWEPTIHNNDMFSIIHNTHGGFGIAQLWGAVSEFFSITESQAHHLFNPRKQMPQLYGGNKLDEYATVEQVADNIIAFIKKVAS